MLESRLLSRSCANSQRTIVLSIDIIAFGTEIPSLVMATTSPSLNNAPAVLCENEPIINRTSYRTHKSKNSFRSSVNASSANLNNLRVWQNFECCCTNVSPRWYWFDKRLYSRLNLECSLEYKSFACTMCDYVSLVTKYLCKMAKATYVKCCGLNTKKTLCCSDDRHKNIKTKVCNRLLPRIATFAFIKLDFVLFHFAFTLYKA